jgi:hypothetical protein
MMKQLITYCILLNFNTVIAQNYLDIKRDGIASIAIGQKIIDEKNFLPIKNFLEKEKYDVMEDESVIYFLKHETINMSCCLKGVYNCFVTLDQNKKIKAINVFLNSETTEIIQLMNQKLGEYTLYSTSGLPGYSKTESYLWAPDLNIRFSLSITKNLRTSNNRISLLIFSCKVNDTAGELRIIEY